MTLRVVVAGAQKIGPVPYGTRVTAPIAPRERARSCPCVCSPRPRKTSAPVRTARAWSFQSPAGRSKATLFGDDWTVKRADRVIELDLRATLETDDGALIHMTFEGVRDDAAPGAPYFRTLARFETGEGKYGFLNELLAAGVGEIRADGPVHLIEELL